MERSEHLFIARSPARPPAAATAAAVIHNSRPRPTTHASVESARSPSYLPSSVFSLLLLAIFATSSQIKLCDPWDYLPLRPTPQTNSTPPPLYHSKARQADIPAAVDTLVYVTPSRRRSRWFFCNRDTKLRYGSTEEGRKMMLSLPVRFAGFTNRLPAFVVS